MTCRTAADTAAGVVEVDTVVERGIEDGVALFGLDGSSHRQKGDLKRLRHARGVADAPGVDN